MRAIIAMTISFYFLTVALAVIACKETDVSCGAFSMFTFIVASLLLWQLTRKYRANKRGFWVSVGLVFLSLFIHIDS